MPMVGLGEELAAYRVEFEALKAIYERINELSTDEAEKAHKTDLLTYQIGEISAAELTPGEEEELMAQRTVARNSERITQSLAAALTLIQGDESGEIPGAAELLEQIAEQLSDVGRYLPDYESLATTIRSHQYDLEESASSIQDSLEEMEYDPARLESIEERLSVIQQLKRNTVRTFLLFWNFWSAPNRSWMTSSSLRRNLLPSSSSEVNSFPVVTPWPRSSPASVILPQRLLSKRSKKNCAFWIWHRYGLCHVLGRRHSLPPVWMNLS